MVKAPRLLTCLRRAMARGAGLALALVASGAGAQVEVRADGFIARFEIPTDRYGHAVMGDLPEWGRICLGPVGAERCTTLPQTRVFEDIAPRLADIDGDGAPEAVVVESSFSAGAALVVYRYGPELQRIATPHIGTRNRWLAPAAIADLDGDGAIEIAYIDRPHLAKTLRIWRYVDGALEQVASAKGLTNHRIGDPFIEGGLRDCGKGPEIVLASANWQRIKVVRLSDEQIKVRVLGRYSEQTMRAALACNG